MKRKAAAPNVVELDYPGGWIDEKDLHVAALIEGGSHCKDRSPAERDKVTFISKFVSQLSPARFRNFFAYVALRTHPSVPSNLSVYRT